MAIFQKLYIWRASADVAVYVVELSKQLAAAHHYALANQIVRASISVPSNIAEGQGRTTNRDRRHFFVQARGSLYELETHLEIARRAGLWCDDAEIHASIHKISAGLTKIINQLASTA